MTTRPVVLKCWCTVVFINCRYKSGVSSQITLHSHHCILLSICHTKKMFKIKFFDLEDICILLCTILLYKEPFLKKENKV